MELRTLVLCCTLISSVAAFTLPDSINHLKSSDNRVAFSRIEDCNCINGRCVKDNRGNIKCICNRGYALQDENTCEPCDCGRLGKCIFIPVSNSEGTILYVKNCVCDSGSAEKDGICVDCQCGENSKCEFENEEKVCYCNEGYAEKDGVCTECDCGYYGECSFQNGSKICTCYEDFEEINGVCVDKCDAFNCQNGGTCKIGNGEPLCECPERFSGKECEIDKCSMTTCYNGGICDIQNGKPVCNCPQGYYGEECEVDECSSTTCENGGECFMSSGKAICKCLANYEGERCELDKCSKLECKNGGTCLIENGNAICKCPDAYSGENCETPACSLQYPCQNGGLCEDGLCRCLPGTSGEFCDVIDDCPNLCPVRSDVNCTYNIKYQKAYCECLGRNISFYADTQECRSTCDEVSCKNGGECKQADFSKFCNCLEGTSGDFCETIDDCPYIDCGNEATCKYDPSIKSPFCQCIDKASIYNPSDRKCKKSCQEDSDCANGGTCIKNGSSGYCNCLEGTKGDFCEEVLGCINKECGDNAECVYDIDRRIAVCKCDENFAFDASDFKCKKPCDSSTDCKNGGTCTGDRSNNRFCRCLNGTMGDFCETVPGCDSKNCGNDAKCVFDTNRKSANCLCSKKKMAFDEISQECKKVCDSSSDCKNGGRCKGDKSKKICQCLDGTRGDRCEIIPECDNKNCGKDAKCVFDKNRKSANCLCSKEKLAFDEISQECKRSCSDDSDCKNGGRCKPRGRYKFCNCRKGTSGDFCEKQNEICKKYCGKEKCVVDKDSSEKTLVKCLCDDKKYFDEDDKSCKKCDCGGKDISCKVKKGKKICICPDGYHDKKGKCHKSHDKDDDR